MMALDVDAIKAHADELVNGYKIAEATMSTKGGSILYAHPDGDKFTLAVSTYHDRELGAERAFLRNALPVLQATSALIAEVERLRHTVKELEAR